MAASEPAHSFPTHYPLNRVNDVSCSLRASGLGVEVDRSPVSDVTAAPSNQTVTCD